MQWRRHRRVTHVIGSSNHVLLLARYQDAPPSEEDEEEGLRNGYMKGQENDTSSRSFDRHGQSGYKTWRSSSGGGSSYASGGTRSHKDDSSGSPSQPKIIFNEEEYTRITTPRQDMLFKKGYLSRKKPWTSNASTSATPSTTESQSASHSTAGRDGSETTEDQQLLDRDCSAGEYPPMMKSGAHLGYGTFYDHASGYYYEYPVMLVGPAPVPAQVGPSILAAVPCDPVPLRPIEWINPAFVPKLAEQQYCMMDYQTGQSTEDSTLVTEQETTLLPVENSSGTCNESCTGSASCNGSVAGEAEEQPTEAESATENQIEEHQAEERTEEHMEEHLEEQYVDEQAVEEQPLENGLNGGPYLEPVLLQQPMHVSHVIPVPQPYMYPGHYMFGPPLVNLNGVTIQGGPMIRTTDVAAMSAACAKRRKKKKRRKPRRLAVGNTEDEEEGEYSSECDTGLPSSRLSWTECSTSTTTTITNRPLNPECQEFQLRPIELDASLSAIPTSANLSTFEEGSSANQSSTLSSDATSVDKNYKACNGVVSDDQKQEDEQLTDSNSGQVAGSEKSQQTSEDGDLETETNGPTLCLTGKDDTCPTNELASVESPSSEMNDKASTNEPCERSTEEPMNGVEETLVNGKLMNSSNEETQEEPLSPCNDERTPKTAENTENHESLTNAKLPKRKYNAKGTKFVREPTPGPDLDGFADLENVLVNEKILAKDKVTNDLSLNGVSLSNDSSPKTESTVNSCEKTEMSNNVCNHLNKGDPVEISNEDSGFESQTRLSDYPITEAVTEWLRRANSPDVFITNASGSESEDEVDEEPPKNLQGNPMPALSANSGADNVALSGCGEFARINNARGQEKKGNGGSRKKRDGKRRSGEQRRVRHVEGKPENEAVSSSDSCGQQEVPSRRKNPARQQDVGDVCEFAEKDSVAGMRVALSSRMMDSKRVNARRTKRQGRSVKDPTDIDAKIRCIEDVDDEGIDEDIEENGKTFEKEEKLLTTSRDDPSAISKNAKETTKESNGNDVEETNSRTPKNETVSSSEVSSRRENPACQDVGEVCESTEKDTIASSSRTMDSKRANPRRAKRQSRSAKDISNIDAKTRHLENVDDENDEGIVEDTNVKTYEKGEIVVSREGKLLTTSRNDASTNKTVPKDREIAKESTRSSEDENDRTNSLCSIEEPDVLECWEAETIEPVITPKRMLQCRGVLCEGEAVEEDTIETKEASVENCVENYVENYVQKYYRLARNSVTSVEEETSCKVNVDPSALKPVPNSSEQTKNTERILQGEKSNNVPIDEAFEVYESCYTGKTPFLGIDAKVFKSRTFYGQKGEGPVPCKPVCCNLQ
ncbi:uncharacterized protein LOC128896348 isoform X3 [Hylaeus anthracinus]|uniref:uncharacterized protein LOC128896348 isoform X3 n=1 Tax=Hylaeus anthracinus TaxID=313031 RepID=UPI0023B9F48A|nr:uncharacterized protein LOC128896348 isoform X3 [Hylaeus anthracinus]